MTLHLYCGSCVFRDRLNGHCCVVPRPYPVDPTDPACKAFRRRDDKKEDRSASTHD